MISTYAVLAVLVSCAATTPPEKCPDSYCPRGEKCVLQTIVCVSAPCPSPQRTCVPVDKPGTCPEERLLKLICISFCHHDEDCPGDLLCCGEDFGRCVHPVKDNVLPKECPLVPPNVVGVCIVKCPPQVCPAGQGCCGSCPRTCKVLVEVKPGSCPRKSPQTCPDKPINTCRKDKECPKAQKCCNTGCALECRVPVR